MDEGSKKQGVQSIGIGVRILRSLVDGGEAMTLTAISRASGIPSSSCHRYLASFIQGGFVVQDSASGRYDLGAGIIHAGLAALRRADPIKVGLSTCERLARSTGRTAQLAIWTESGPVVVSWRVGDRPLPTNLGVGARLPAVGSATGRAFLAFMPSLYWESAVIAEGYSVEEAKRIVEPVRAERFATVEGDLVPGLSVMAAPILDARGLPSTAIALLGRRGQLHDADRDALIQATEDASSELGDGATFPM